MIHLLIDDENDDDGDVKCEYSLQGTTIKLCYLLQRNTYVDPTLTSDWRQRLSAICRLSQMSNFLYH